MSGYISAMQSGGAEITDMSETAMFWTTVVISGIFLIIDVSAIARESVMSDLYDITGQFLRAAQQVLTAQTVNIPQKEDPLPLKRNAEHGGMIVEGAFFRHFLSGWILRITRVSGRHAAGQGSGIMVRRF